MNKKNNIVSISTIYLSGIFTIFYMLNTVYNLINNVKVSMNFSVTYGNLTIAIGIIVLVYYIFKFKYSILCCDSNEEKNKKKRMFYISFIMIWGGILILGYILQVYVVFTAPIYLIVGIPFGINLIINMFKKIIYNFIKKER